MPLRVIGGSARGLLLRTPAGSETRPTSARLRESLFGMLEAAGTPLDSVVDLYAGSGALGIEALSRGAERCVFVDSSRQACRVIRENLDRTRFADRAQVTTARVGRWQAPDGAAFSLVLADPPYGDDGAWTDIDRAISRALDEESVIAVEHSARTEPPATLAGRPRWRERRQGDGAVALYRRDDTPAAQSKES